MNYRWEVDWYSFMVSKLGYVVIMMDVSGSGYSGDATRKAVHRRVGSLETEDMLRVLRSAGYRKLYTDFPSIFLMTLDCLTSLLTLLYVSFRLCSSET